MIDLTFNEFVLGRELDYQYEGPCLVREGEEDYQGAPPGGPYHDVASIVDNITLVG